MHGDLPARPKSQRLVDRNMAEKPAQYFQQFKRKSQNITNINELLPGLNDISDAFEAMPIDLVKYLTLLKEIDAKCIKSIPLINHNISSYINTLHETGENAPTRLTKIERLQRIRKQIHDVVPCLEEKMHVTSVASDVIGKHMSRINNDYKVIIGNNEIPESVRLGPFNHRAIIMEAQGSADASKSVNLQRSESRREAIAAKRASKDDDDDDTKKRKGTTRDVTPVIETSNKRRRKENEKVSGPVFGEKDKKKANGKPKVELGDELASSRSTAQEPTYCYCNQVSFGEMVGCDGETCLREWFHLPCIGFKNPPKGKWYCDECVAKMKKAKK